MGAQPYLFCLHISECSSLAGVTPVKQSTAKQEFSVPVLKIPVLFHELKIPVKLAELRDGIQKDS